MGKPKVSIIIPIYQAEQSIERCCHSLFRQTLFEIEFIFVNDGSKDKSIELIEKVLKEYPNRVTQTKILDRKENHGVAYTRQEGLDNATGEYVIHCDSDDWVESSMYECLYQQALINNADIVCCGYMIESANAVIKEVTYSNANYFKSVGFNISPLTGSLSNKLIRRELIVQNKIQFPNNIGWGEDFCFVIACLLVSKEIICLSDCLYHYWQNESSITHNVSQGKAMELVLVADHVENFLKRTNFIDLYRLQLNYLKFQVKAPFLMFKEIRDIPLWRKLFPECHENVMQYATPLYLRFAAWFITHRLSMIGKVCLSLRDLYQKHIRS